MDGDLPSLDDLANPSDPEHFLIQDHVLENPETPCDRCGFAIPTWMIFDPKSGLERRADVVYDPTDPEVDNVDEPK